MSIFSLHSRLFGSKQKGFTLIEMLVVTAIISIITLMLLLRQSRFSSSVVMRSLAYSVALSVRQAQVYGTSVLGVGGGASPVYASAYGLSVSSPASYTLFADSNNNGIFDSGEVVKVFSLNNGYTISEACAISSPSVRRCIGAADTTSTRIGSLNILFKRPNPDAVIVPISTSGAVIPGGFTSAYIQIHSLSGTTRSVRVYITGGVVVEPPCTTADGTTSASC